MLYTIREMALLLLQISAFLIALLVVWIFIMTAADARKGVKKPDSNEPVGNQTNRHKKKTKTCFPIQFLKWKADRACNNYRKMHGLPLIRRKRR